MLLILKDIHSLKKQLRSWHDKNITLVPTMGSLHQGHLYLVEQACKHGGRVIVSIFINPTQFAPKEDFSQYPRDLARDLELLSPYPIDAVFTPEATELFSPSYQSFVENTELARALCGISRPNFFRGVCTVVLKLFLLTNCNTAIFGKKDYQQLKIIEQMIKDFHLDVKILSQQIIREKNGLAMSSRNAYLNAEQKKHASYIYKGLLAARKLYEEGEINGEAIRKQAHEIICMHQKLEIEYLELRQQSDLSLIESLVNTPAVLLTAVRFAGVRLIDNIEMD